MLITLMRDLKLLRNLKKKYNLPMAFYGHTVEYVRNRLILELLKQ